MARDRAFLVSLGVATAFHLSMFTVFTIVISFPVKTVDHYEVDLINVQTYRPFSASRQVFEMPTVEQRMAIAAESQVSSPLDTDFRLKSNLGLDAAPSPTLPPVEFPRLQSAELRLVEQGRESLQMQATYEQRIAEAPRDSWAQFGEGLGRLRDSLSRLPIFDDTGADSEPDYIPVDLAVEGFQAHIEWVTAPYDRQLVFSPPIKDLWGLNPSALRSSYALSFTVNTAGEVVRVLNLDPDASGVLEGVAIALTRYRFEPVGGGQTDQQGIFLIAPQRSAP